MRGLFFREVVARDRPIEAQSRFDDATTSLAKTCCWTGVRPDRTLDGLDLPVAGVLAGSLAGKRNSFWAQGRVASSSCRRTCAGPFSAPRSVAGLRGARKCRRREHRRHPQLERRWGPLWGPRWPCRRLTASDAALGRRIDRQTFRIPGHSTARLPNSSSPAPQSCRYCVPSPARQSRCVGSPD